MAVEAGPSTLGSMGQDGKDRRWCKAAGVDSRWQQTGAGLEAINDGRACSSRSKALLRGVGASAGEEAEGLSDAEEPVSDGAGLSERERLDGGGGGSEKGEWGAPACHAQGRRRTAARLVAHSGLGLWLHGQASRAG